MKFFQPFKSFVLGRRILELLMSDFVLDQQTLPTDKSVPITAQLTQGNKMNSNNPTDYFMTDYSSSSSWLAIITVKSSKYI